MSRRRIVFIGTASLTAVICSLLLSGPLRLLAPEAFGLSCQRRICVEDVRRHEAAADLVRGASEEIEGLTGQRLPQRTIVLCTTPECYRRFGGRAERAISFPWLGTVVSGPDWQAYIVRHELIHWLQFERYGAIETMSYPTWFREGMAYALSDAPDSDVPSHYQPLISQYRDWQGRRGNDQLWQARPVF